MYNLRTILLFQQAEYKRIHTLAEQIHPKLCRRISYAEISDPKFNAELYDEKYKEKILPEIRKYYQTLRKMIDEHLAEFIEGWLMVNPENRWAIDRDTGRTCDSVEFNLTNKYHNYIIDLELESYISTVIGMLDDYKITMYWEHSFYTSEGGKRIYLDSYSTGKRYIESAKERFKSFRSNYELLEDLALDSKSLPYKMNLPAMSAEMAHNIRNSDLKNTIKHHKILYQFFETFGTDPEGGAYISYEDKDKKITVKRIDE